MQLLNDADGEPAEQAAHQQSSQHIRWIMYIQIHTGKGDESCQNHSRNPHAPLCQKQHHGGGKGGHGVTGGEGVIQWCSDQ